MFEGSFDNSYSSETITIQSLIFRESKIRAKTHIVNHLNKMMYVGNKLFYIISQTLVPQYIHMHIIIIISSNVMHPLATGPYMTHL